LYTSFCIFIFFFSSRRRHTRFSRDWSSDVCSSDLRDGCLGQREELLAPLVARCGSEGPASLSRSELSQLFRSKKALSELHRYARSEERRVGKECRCGGGPGQKKEMCTKTSRHIHTQ